MQTDWAFSFGAGIPHRWPRLVFVFLNCRDLLQLLLTAVSYIFWTTGFASHIPGDRGTPLGESGGTLHSSFSVRTTPNGVTSVS